MSIADIVIYIALLPQLDETSVGAMVPLIGMCHEKCLCAASPNVFLACAEICGKFPCRLSLSARLGLCKLTCNARSVSALASQKPKLSQSDH